MDGARVAQKPIVPNMLTPIYFKNLFLTLTKAARKQPLFLYLNEVIYGAASN